MKWYWAVLFFGCWMAGMFWVGHLLGSWIAGA